MTTIIFFKWENKTCLNEMTLSRLRTYERLLRSVTEGICKDEHRLSILSPDPLVRNEANRVGGWGSRDKGVGDDLGFYSCTNSASRWLIRVHLCVCLCVCVFRVSDFHDKYYFLY